MKDDIALHHILNSEHGSFTSYTIGFVLSILLTFASYFLVVDQVFAGWNLVFAITGLGMVQVLIQLVFFLHLGQEPKPYWNLLIFAFMVAVLIIIVVGSLWVMYNLDARMM
jgi:cytochrome o ubiquinol oxidase operon protein cyoD